jgi:hypothetical protein
MLYTPNYVQILTGLGHMLNDTIAGLTPCNPNSRAINQTHWSHFDVYNRGPHIGIYPVLHLSIRMVICGAI